jgi:D-amino peptidase
MKLMIMTDMEGVAGVISGKDYLYPTGRYYETARRLLTEETNAAIDGFWAGGFRDILVCDGHGAGGINPDLLDERVRLQRGWGPATYPFGLDSSFDALAYVGQHAKAGTRFSHLTHTGWWSVVDQTVNGLSIGEYGEGALCAGELGVSLIFAAGEEALTREAAALTPWVVTVSVLQGVHPEAGDELSMDEYEVFHEAAIHLHPRRACQLIRQGAQQAAQRFSADRAAFPPLRCLQPPYHLHRVIRRRKDMPGKTIDVQRDRLIDLFNNKNG